MSWPGLGPIPSSDCVRAGNDLKNLHFYHKTAFTEYKYTFYKLICHVHFIFYYLIQVKIWFQNRRMKWRNSKERELLSSGGNRDSTIPSKENPHPDLSDAPASDVNMTPNMDANTEFPHSEHSHMKDLDRYESEDLDFNNGHSESFEYENYSDDSDEEINVS